MAPLAATARSGIPSPLKSAVTISLGDAVTVMVEAVPNVPSPRPSRMETELPPELATAISATPSPLKSAETMPFGFEPTT